MSDTPTVVYVHGGGAQPPDDKEFLGKLDGWIDLRGRAQSRLSCYDHIRRPGPREVAALQETGDPRLAPDVAAGVLVDAIEPPPGYSVPAGARDIAREFLASQFRCLESVAREESIDEATVREMALKLSDAAADTIAYLFIGWAEPMRAPVIATIEGIEGPLVIVAHSLGSIIVYDILTNRPTPVVWLFLAVGSPMGNPLIRARRIGRLFCRSRVPRPVRSWVNAFDRQDIVSCAYPEIEGKFHPSARLLDVDVDNPARNHHDLDGYLKIQAVRDALTRGLVPPAP